MKSKNILQTTLKFAGINKTGLPAAIWVLPSQDMKIIPSEKEFIKGYAILVRIFI